MDAEVVALIDDGISAIADAFVVAVVIVSSLVNSFSRESSWALQKQEHYQIQELLQRSYGLERCKWQQLWHLTPVSIQPLGILRRVPGLPLQATFGAGMVVHLLLLLLPHIQLERVPLHWLGPPWSNPP